MLTFVLIADAARARFFLVLGADHPDYTSGPRLREEKDLVNPEGQLTGTEKFENNKSGRGRASGGGPAHGLDDHREGHDREVEKRFAKRIATDAAKHFLQGETGKLIVVAPSRLLGALRSLLPTQLPSKVKVEEVERDLSAQTLPKIEEVLEQHGLLEPRVVKGRKHRAPGQPLD
jgi:protein required for attachment to host cells